MSRLPPWVLLCCISWFQCSSSTAFGLKCKPNSSFPHPLGCGSYYLCGDDKERHHFECPPGLLYHEEKRACDWATNVRCNLSEKLENLKEDIRLLELVKKYGLDVPINNTEDATSDPPVLATILDFEEKCLNLNENKTIEDVEKLLKDNVSECGETLVHYMYQALEELDEKYNLTELLENGKSRYLAGLLEHKSISEDMEKEKDGLIEKEHIRDREKGEQQDEHKLDGPHEGKEEGEGETVDKEQEIEQTVKDDQDKSGTYKDQNKTQTVNEQNEYELHTETDYNKFNLTSNNDHTLEETYSTILSNIEKRQVDDNVTTEEANPAKLFYRKMLMIDSQDVNKSDSGSNITDAVTFSGEGNSTSQENTTNNYSVKPFEYQPHFPLLNIGKMQLDLLGYDESKVICSNETCSVDDHAHADQQDKVDRETLPEDQQQERNSTQLEETNDEEYSTEGKPNQQVQPQERNTTQIEESKDENHSHSVNLGEETDQLASLKDQPQEHNTTQTDKITDKKSSLFEDHEDTNDQRTTLEEIETEEKNNKTTYTFTDENTEKTLFGLLYGIIE